MKNLTPYFGILIACTMTGLRVLGQNLSLPKQITSLNDTVSIYSISLIGEVKNGEFLKTSNLTCGQDSSLVRAASKIFGNRFLVKKIDKACISSEPHDVVRPNLTEVYYPSKSHSGLSETAVFSDSAIFSNLFHCHSNYVMVYVVLWMYKGDEEHKRDEYKHSVYYGSWPRIYYGAVGTFVTMKIAIIEMSKRRVVYECVYQSNFRNTVLPENRSFNSLLVSRTRRMLRNAHSALKTSM